MKFVFGLLLVVASVSANLSLHRYGWAPGKESVYQFESQVLNGVHEIKKDQRSGIKLTSQVRVQSYSDYSLRIKMENTQFKSLNGEVKLSENDRLQGRSGMQDEHIPEEYKRHLEKPFLAHVKGGVISSFLVDREEPSAVTNIKRAFLSQLQLDVSGTQRSQIESNHIQLQTPEEQSGRSGQNDLSDMSYFKTKEESVHGKCLTSYTIHKLPEYKVKELEEQWSKEEQQLQEQQRQRQDSHQQSRSEQAQRYCQGKPYYQVIKTKDFDHCDISPIFQKWTGVTGKCNLNKPSTCTNTVIRTSSSSYYVCGELSQFQIRKIQTENIVKVNPYGYNIDESFQTTTQINLELLKVKSITERLPIPSSTKEENSLVYAFPQQSELQGRISEEIIKRSNQILGVSPLLPQPGLNEAPKSLLPITIPKEQIKSQCLEQLKKMAIEVFQSPQSCSSKSDIAGTMASVAKYLRHLSLEQLKQLDSEIKQERNQGQELSPLEKLFLDTLSAVGTNPSTMLVVQKIKEGSLPTLKAQKIIVHTLRNVRYPTEELLRELVSMAKHQTVKSNKDILSVVLPNLSDLIYRAYINPSTMINNFPSQLYGVFGTNESQVLTEQYVPYLVSLVQGQESGIESQSAKQHLQYSATVSLGRTGHLKAVNTLLKVAEGKIKEVESKFQQEQGQGPEEAKILRPLAVHSLKKIAKMNPAQVKPLLMAIIQNPLEAPEVRTAAVAVLPFTQPGPNDIQIVAIRSWFEPSKEVANFIRSTLISLIDTEVPEFKPMSGFAKNALPLMKQQQDNELSFSRNIHFNKFVEYLKTGIVSKLQVEKSKKSMVPLRVAGSTKYYGSQGSFKVGELSWEMYMQGMDKLVEKYVKYFTYAGKTSEQTRRQLDQIVEQLGIETRGFKKAQYYGLTSIMGAKWDNFLDSEVVVEALERLTEEAEQDNKSWNFNTVGGSLWQESTTFGMSDAGFPIVSSVELPIVYSAKGQVKITNLPESQNGKPQLPQLEVSVIPVLNAKAQSFMGVISPFTKEVIGTGVVASLHSSIPLDLKAKLADGELEIVLKNPTENEVSGRETETLHGFVLPYTFKANILSVKPTSKAASMKKIVSETPRSVEMPIGKSLGLSAKLIFESNNVYSDLSSYVEKIRQHSLGSLMSAGIVPSTIRMSSTKIKYNPIQSETKELQLKIKVNSQGLSHQGVQQIRSEEIESDFQSVRSVLNQIKSEQNGKAVVLSLSAGSKQQNSSRKLKSAIIVGKTSEQNEKVSKTYLAVNYMPENSQVYGIKYEGQSTLTQPKNRWNLEQLLQEDLQAEYSAKISYGKSGEEKQIQLSGKMQKSEEFKQSVRQSPEYKQCEQQMQNDRKLTEVCRQARSQAASLDKFEVKIEKCPSSMKKSSLLNLAKELIEASLIGQISYEQGSQAEYEVKVQGKIDRTGQVAQVKVHTKSGQIAKIENIRLSEYTKNLLPYSVHNQLFHQIGQTLSISRTPMTCSVEPKTVNTFDNKTYTYQINDCEHLLLQDGGKNYPIAVLSRTLSGNQKEVRIISGESEVKVTPQGGSIQVKVNGQQIELRTGEVKKIRSQQGQYVQVEMKKYQDNTHSLYFPQQYLTVLTNGKRIEIVGSELVKTRAVGLCGDMNNENTADLKTPRKCVMSPQAAAVSYLLNKSGSSQVSPRCEGIPSQYRQKWEKESQQCLKEYVVPTPLEKIFNQIKSIAVPRTRQHVVDKQTGQTCISKQMVKMCQGSPSKIRQTTVNFVCISRPSTQARSLEKRALAGEPLTHILNQMPTTFSKVEFEPVSCSQESSRLGGDQW